MRQINAGDSAWALVRCEGLKAVMQSACATGFKVPDGFYTITAREGVAMLVSLSTPIHLCLSLQGPSLPSSPRQVVVPMAYVSEYLQRIFMTEQ